jgi:hypothetical protein
MGVVPSQITAVTITWSVPRVGATPISYTANYRKTEQTAWIAAASGLPGTFTSDIGLSVSASYDFELIQVMALILPGGNWERTAK